MTIAEKCLQQRIGNCAGCPVLGIVLDKRGPMPIAEERTLISKISRELCPNGTVMQVPAKPERPLM